MIKIYYIAGNLGCHNAWQVLYDEDIGESTD